MHALFVVLLPRIHARMVVASTSPHHVGLLHTQVSCKALAGQSYEAAAGVLAAAAAECLARCPGLLLLDDLDLLLPAPNTDGPSGLEQVGEGCQEGLQHIAEAHHMLMTVCFGADSHAMHLYAIMACGICKHRYGGAASITQSTSLQDLVMCAVCRVDTSKHARCEDVFAC
jgi:hypothetical protein